MEVDLDLPSELSRRDRPRRSGCALRSWRWTGPTERETIAPMIAPLVQERLGQLRELCVRHRVRRLELFGSATCARFDAETSDLDFLVEFEDLGERGYFDAYFGLLEGLQGVFERRVDLVMRGAVRNPYFLENIESSRTLLYAA